MNALNTIKFSQLQQWDIKRLVQSHFHSKLPISSLGGHIIEQNQKYYISESDQQYGILGVNNKIGIFDAYIEKGSNIHQKYKKMYDGWIAYNPYRINVGSIGIKHRKHQYEYISPAYVVFSCTSDLLPEYLFLLMKTPSFNKIIRENTTGSVRQNLSFKTLQKLRLPLPETSVQNKFVAKYNQAIAEAKTKEEQAGQLENAIEQYLLSTLGIKQNTQEGDAHLEHLHITNYKQLSQWGYDYLLWNGKSILESTLYPNVLLSKLMDVNPQTSFSSLDKDNDVSFVPMECVSDVYGELKERKVVKVSQSKGFTKFQNGDLIWARITPCMQNGKSAIVDDLQNGFGCGSTEFHILRKFSSEVMTEFVYCLLRTHYVLEDAKRYFTGSAGQQRVPKSYLNNLAIPLPHIDIQKEIVSHIFDMKSAIKFLKQQASDLRKKALSDFENEIFE